MLAKAVLSAVIVAVAALGATAAQAGDHEVRMLNKGERGVMVFEPAVLQIAPGDTVTFVPTDMGHNVESIEGMLPEGAEPFVGKMNEKVVVTFEKEGVYGFKCKPHYAMGMVGLIVVGDAAANRDSADAVKQKGRAKQAFQALFAEIAG